MDQAVFCVTPLSQCSFMLFMPFGLVISGWMAETRWRVVNRDRSSAVPVSTKNDLW